ncbi:bacteriocin [Photobacterium nomapromontoriensis]|uniref:bacteriocin n=1 Tax=Photobacterium nomapromontoriensis TaxID=2910237 RepID=UPI003D099E97
MSYSVLQLGGDTRKQAMSGLRDAANREEEVDRMNKQLKTAERTQTMSAMGSGAAMGAMVGMQAGSVGGPMGMAIGAVGGLILGELF